MGQFIVYYIKPYFLKVDLSNQISIKKIVTNTLGGYHYLAELLEVYKPTRSLWPENQLNLRVPKMRLKSYGDRAFCNAAPVLWNQLPVKIKTASSLEVFKAKLKCHFFTSKWPMYVWNLYWIPWCCV